MLSDSDLFIRSASITELEQVLDLLRNQLYPCSRSQAGPLSPLSADYLRAVGAKVIKDPTSYARYHIECNFDVQPLIDSLADLRLRRYKDCVRAIIQSVPDGDLVALKDALLDGTPVGVGGATCANLRRLAEAGPFDMFRIMTPSAEVIYALRPDDSIWAKDARECFWYAILLLDGRLREISN